MNRPAVIRRILRSRWLPLVLLVVVVVDSNVNYPGTWASGFVAGMLVILLVDKFLRWMLDL